MIDVRMTEQEHRLAYGLHGRNDHCVCGLVAAVESGEKVYVVSDPFSRRRSERGERAEGRDVRFDLCDGPGCPCYWEAVAALSAEVEALQARLDAADALHQPVAGGYWFAARRCRHDADPWPCPTHRALYPKEDG